MKINRHIAINANGLVFDASSGDQYSLNATALTILRLIDEGRSREAIVEQLTIQYEVAAQEVSRDLADFIASLKRNKLLATSE